MIIDDIITLPPNWESKPTIERTWKTGIQTSVVGLEIRSALFTWPRRRLQFTIDSLTAAESNFLRRILWKNLHNVLGIPFWMDRTTLTAQANSGQAVLQVADTTNRNFEAGAPCVVMTAYDTYEYAEILSFTDTSITLNTNLVSTWATGNVYPVLQSRFDWQQQLGGVTSTIANLSVDADEAFDADVTKVFIGADPFITHLSRPVFTLEPNWRTTVDQTIGRPYDIWKFLGKEAVDTSREESVIGTKALFTFYNRADLYEFIKFFDYVRGRWGRFYCPTWMKDVVVTSAIGSADTVLDVEAIDWSNYWDIGYDVGPAGSNLFLWAPDGTKVAREIVDEPTTTTLELGKAVGIDVTAEGLYALLCSFLPLSRFATDSIEIKYEAENVAEVQVTFVTIPGVSSYSSSSSSSRSSSSSSSSLSSSSSSLSSSSSSSSLSSSSSSSWSSFSSSSSSSSKSSSSSSSSLSSSSSSSLSSSSSSSSQSSSSSSYSVGPQWNSIWDNTDFQIYPAVPRGSWQTDHWEGDVGSPYYLTISPVGGWEVGYRPSKMRITFSNYAGPIGIYLYDTSNFFIVNDDTISNLDELTIDFATKNLDIKFILFRIGMQDAHIDNIEWFI